MSVRLVVPVCCAALLAVGLAGCSGSDDAKKPAGASSSAPSPSGSPSGTASGGPDPQLAATRNRVQQAGTGSFTQADEKADGSDVASAKGGYSLDDESLSATVKIPDTTSKKVANARVRVVGGKAFLQVDQWKKPSRSCWLASTPTALSQQYALDVSSGSVPLGVALMDEFVVQGSSGPGTFQGQVTIAAALPLLSGSLKQQLEQAKPRGAVPAFLVDDGKTVTITVPGYGIVPELSAALGVQDTQFDSIKNDRYVVTLTPGKQTGGAVTAPAAAKQMTDKQLAANRC